MLHRICWLQAGGARLPTKSRLIKGLGLRQSAGGPGNKGRAGCAPLGGARHTARRAARRSAMLLGKALHGCSSVTMSQPGCSCPSGTAVDRVGHCQCCERMHHHLARLAASAGESLLVECIQKFYCTPARQTTQPARQPS